MSANSFASSRCEHYKYTVTLTWQCYGQWMHGQWNSVSLLLTILCLKLKCFDYSLVISNIQMPWHAQFFFHKYCIFLHWQLHMVFLIFLFFLWTHGSTKGHVPLMHASGLAFQRKHEIKWRLSTAEQYIYTIQRMELRIFWVELKTIIYLLENKLIAFTLNIQKLCIITIWGIGDTFWHSLFIQNAPMN